MYTYSNVNLVAENKLCILDLISDVLVPYHQRIKKQWGHNVINFSALVFTLRCQIL